MSTIRYELVYATARKAYTLIDYNIHTDMHKQYEFRKQTILADKLLTDDEKAEAIKYITETYDRNKILLNLGTKRICENSGWINGYYKEWDSKKRQLKRVERNGEGLVIDVVLKKLENVESANKSWFEEAKSHLTIASKCPDIVRCYGMTQDISNGNYMLVMMRADFDLRKYLQQNYNQLTWKEKIRIIYEITTPEVINGKGYTFASDIYSIAILMWEISSGYPPFINYKHDDYNLAMDIINGIRPEIVTEIPLEYKSLMEQCWDADPSKRPDIIELDEQIQKIHLSYQNMPDKLFQLKIKDNFKTKTSINHTSSRLFTSKIYQFENLSEPKNATEGEQEAYHSRTYDFSIPNNIDDFNNSSNQKINNTSRINSIFKASSKRLSKVFKKLQINSKNDIQHNNKIETTQHLKGPINDEEEAYNNPNLHSEEQDELEIPGRF
ncbi:kinase-like domain-containing protein [Rhizophagus clarus]|uniref:Kinase-like domain-containing protein n=1 Tax=Rhizophagus clarus TaxID=94130 RepID=A0A8H3QGM4_9GLOM|nr:kinase-like domain-containing protein [Rhizophagus clarus]